MKYIRTNQDKIYEVDEKEMIACPNDDGTTDVYFKLKSDKLINRNDVIKESDKLEELCDEFVIKYKYNKDNLSNYTFQKCSSLKHALTYLELVKENKRDYLFYGSIWTDKGLIYVAKLNNKGELELL